MVKAKDTRHFYIKLSKVLLIEFYSISNQMSEHSNTEQKEEYGTVKVLLPQITIHL